MKTVKECLLNRKSIRRYERQAIETDKIEFIYQAIQNTATSYNGQQFSVIAVSDQALKEELSTLMNQKQIKTCALFLVFCIDYNKAYQLSKAKSLPYPAFDQTEDGYTVGVIDAALAMQNAQTAAESVGLGSCCIGYTRTSNPPKIAQLLNLPQKVMVVCGLSIGYPRENPDLKPKQPLSLVIHQNGYRADDLTPELKTYDTQVTHYNQAREGDKTANDWIGHMLDYYQMALKYDIEGYKKQQGL